MRLSISVRNTRQISRENHSVTRKCSYKSRLYLLLRLAVLLTNKSCTRHLKFHGAIPPVFSGHPALHLLFPRRVLALVQFTPSNNLYFVQVKRDPLLNVIHNWHSDVHIYRPLRNWGKGHVAMPRSYHSQIATIARESQILLSHDRRVGPN